MQRFSTCGINVKFEINSKGIRQHRRNKMRIKMRKNEYLVQHKAIFLGEGGNGRLATDKTYFKNNDTSLSVREEWYEGSIENVNTRRRRRRRIKIFSFDALFVSKKIESKSEPSPIDR